MARKRRKMGEILKRWGVVKKEQVEEALKIASGSRQRIGETMVELGMCSESDVAKALASQFDMEYIDLDQTDAINKDALKLLPSDIIRKYLVLPLSKEDGRLKVLIHDPIDLETLDNLRFRMNCDIETALGAKGRIKEYIDRVMSVTQASIDQTVRAMTVDATGQSIDVDGGASIDVDGSGEDGEAEAQAPVIRLVNQIIAEGVTSRTSDIHVEPMANRVQLRYRIDGVCLERDRIPKRTQAAITARLKIMAGVKVEEKRVPQDGRIKLRIGTDVIDFRVSFLPTYHGESVVLRILRPESVRIGLANLGMRDDTREQFEDLIKRPNGIFLVTGPTGSGKTTTLYTALDVLNRPDVKIITAEDPVEYSFKGINQVQVRHDIGLTFSLILRAMLRQAPNVVLVGEIRDKEVADVAIQAALTGHLVFSTLHTNDAAGAITRLTDMGVKPFLVASSIQAVLAQRLVRILCEKCRAPDLDPSAHYMKLCGVEKHELEGKQLMRAMGCKDCADTGYRGRRGIYELMMMNGEIRDLAFTRAPLSKLRTAALQGGMRNLLGDAKLKALDGGTTLEEVARVTQVAGVGGGDDEE
jgi:type IV pilus assembly protein PilB